MKIYIFPNDESNNITCFLGVAFGGKHNLLKKNSNTINLSLGMAHFIEHRLFDDGNRKNKTLINYYPEIDIYTNYNSTCFSFNHVINSGENYAQKLKALLGFTRIIDLDEKGIEADKRIVINELKLYNSKIKNKLNRMIIREMYKNTPLQEDIVGTENSIRNINVEEIKFCHDYFYKNENMIMIISGNVNIDETILIIENELKDSKEDKSQYDNIYLNYNRSIINKVSVFNHRDKKSYGIIGIKIKSKEFNSLELLKSDMINKIIVKKVIQEVKSLNSKEIEKISITSEISRELNYILIYYETVKSFEAIEILINSCNKKDEKVKLDEVWLNSIKRKIIKEINGVFANEKIFNKVFADYYFRGMNILDYYEAIKMINLKDIYKRFIEISKAPKSVILFKGERS